MASVFIIVLCTTHQVYKVDKIFQREKVQNRYHCEESTSTIFCDWLRVIWELLLCGWQAVTKDN